MGAPNAEPLNFKLASSEKSKVKFKIKHRTVGCQESQSHHRRGATWFVCCKKAVQFSLVFGQSHSICPTD